MALLLTLLIIAGSLVHCQSPVGDDASECQIAKDAFNENSICQVTYEDIVGERGCKFGRDSVLCAGECAERARMINCTCRDVNSSVIINNIGRLCNCESNITCPMPKTSNCSNTRYAFDAECGVAYSGLIRPSNGNTCSTCCTTLCNSPQCNKLAKNISCYCSEMSEGYQIIRNISSLCECSVKHCNSSASNLQLSPWILMAMFIATQWILGIIDYGFIDMSYQLRQLSTKKQIDSAIRDTEDKVLLLRFGKDSDPTTMQLDNTLMKNEQLLSKMADIYCVDSDAVPVYTKYFDITITPATIFFFNGQHIKVDWGTPDHTKFIGSFRCSQDLIDVVEVVYRGAMKGKLVVSSPLEAGSVTKYSLIYKDI